MDTKTKIWLAVAVVIIVAIFVITGIRKNNPDLLDNNTPEAGEIESTEDTAPVSVAGPDIAVTSTAVSLSYTQALAKYADSKIQFGIDNCNATPNNMSIKSGTSIMLDNRSPQTRTFNINGTVTVKGYGFRIITLSSKTLPKTILVDCGSAQNVATILLQK